MKRIFFSGSILLSSLPTLAAMAETSNIEPNHKSAWSKDAGWIDFRPKQYGGVKVCADHLEGFAWGENIGWIKLGIHQSENGCDPHHYQNTDHYNWGVNRNGNLLSGYAWSKNVGWFNFAPQCDGCEPVTLNKDTGEFKGYVWSERAGWIQLGQDYGVYYQATSAGDCSNRFTDNGDGTVTDNCTKLIWLQDANCFRPQSWDNANNMAALMTKNSGCIPSGTSAGDWRLPTVQELQNLIDYSRYEPALPSGLPFSDVQMGWYYWSSTEFVNYTSNAWHVYFSDGYLGTNVKSNPGYVWPVRRRQ
jgi:hypothetical protein